MSIKSSDLDKSMMALPLNCALPYWGKIADLPRGWQVCDGTNGTPNLVDRFIRGTNLEDEVGKTYEDTTRLPRNTKFNPSIKNSRDFSREMN